MAERIFVVVYDKKEPYQKIVQEHKTLNSEDSVLEMISKFGKIKTLSWVFSADLAGKEVIHHEVIFDGQLKLKQKVFTPSG